MLNHRLAMYSGLPGKRDDAIRAGMIPTMQVMSRNDFASQCHNDPEDADIKLASKVDWSSKEFRV